MNCSFGRFVLGGASALFWLCFSAYAQPIFSSDGEDPKQAGGAQLLEAVCPGRVVIGQEIRCRIVCPAFTDFPGSDFVWSLDRVTRGHFLSPTSEDAVLQMGGCESHAANSGGTILLTRRSERWIMIWYKQGVYTAACHKVSLVTGREILVCMGTYGGQGNNTTALYVEDLIAPTATLMSGNEKEEFFQAFDNTLTCGWNPDDDSKPIPLKRAYIEQVEFKNNGAKPTISVTAGFGEKAVTEQDVKLCMNEQNKNRFYPVTKRYRIDFFFDGRHYRVAPSSAVSAQVFLDR